MIKEINPNEAKRAEAFELWNNAPNPMVTVFKTIDVTRLLKFSRENIFRKDEYEVLYQFFVHIGKGVKLL